MQRQDRFTLNIHAFKMGILYVLYKIMLDFIYVKWVSPIFGYSGFKYEPNINKIIASYIMILLIFIILPKTNQKVSYLILQLHFIIMIIPLTSVFALANLSTNFMMMVIICFVMQIQLVKYLVLIKISKIRNAKKLITGLLIFFTVITYFYLLKTQTINFNAFNISNIYEVRSNQTNFGIMGYFITWQYRIINPALLVISYLRKNYSLSVIAIAMQLTLYLMFPHKEVFLSLGLILLIIFINYYRYKFDSTFVYFLSISSIVCIYIYEVLNNLHPFSVLPVRFLYVPALIKFQHYDFFSNNELLFYSEGMIGKFLGLDYPYSVASGFLIGGNTNNANAGYIAYAYDNAGFFGMLFMSLIFVFILLLIDSLVKYQNKYVIFSLFIYPITILNDGDLLTLLLTGGVWLLLIILFVFNGNNWGSRTKGL